MRAVIGGRSTPGFIGGSPNDFVLPITALALKSFIDIQIAMRIHVDDAQRIQMPPRESGMTTTECHAWDAKQCWVVTTMCSAIARRQARSRGVPALDGYTSCSFLPSSSAGIFLRTDRAARLTNEKRKSLSRRTFAFDTVSRIIKDLQARHPWVARSP